uniref:TBC1 domain family member 7 n=1 Tax=Timspurckia oligopyrenoides TaxID=708627 RepID=A0A7S0ZJG3_9RHOD|mmetsp:Transcript_7735/g.14044  ORF Transcript_7735/g.14044 Transcript_7735/m.14044 type:complete len:626 (+) Transcript_7735:64-1941(+)
MNFRASYLATLGIEPKDLPSESEFESLLSDSSLTSNVTISAAVSTNDGGVHSMKGQDKKDIISVENSISMPALRRLSFRSSIPIRWRPLAWKLLLGVLPSQRAAWALVSKAKSDQMQELIMIAQLVFRQRLKQLQQLETQLIVATKDTETNEQESESETESSAPQLLRVETLVCAYVILQRLGSGTLHGVIPNMQSLRSKLECSVEELGNSFRNTSNSVLSHAGMISNSDLDEEIRVRAVMSEMCSVFESDSDAFWCGTTMVNMNALVAVSRTTGIYESLSATTNHVRIFAELLPRELPHLAAHITDTLGIHPATYSSAWFRSYFAHSLPRDVLHVIWDRLLCAPVDYIVFVAIALMHDLQDTLLSISDTQEALQLLHRPPVPKSIDRLFSHADDRENNASGNVAGTEAPNAIGLFGGGVGTARKYRAGIGGSAGPLNLLEVAVAGLQWPVVRAGTRTPLVRCLQYLLRHRGLGSFFSIDGYYGVRTAGAVERLRLSLGLGASNNNNNRSSDSSLGERASDSFDWRTSEVGPELWPRLIDEYCTMGSRGELVRAVQVILRATRQYSMVRVDGFFGKSTLDAVRHFQARRATYLLVDGIVGPITWFHMLGSLDFYDKSSSLRIKPI